MTLVVAVAIFSKNALFDEFLWNWTLWILMHLVLFLEAFCTFIDMFLCIFCALLHAILWCIVNSVPVLLNISYFCPVSYVLIYTLRVYVCGLVVRSCVRRESSDLGLRLSIIVSTPHMLTSNHKCNTATSNWTTMTASRREHTALLRCRIGLVLCWCAKQPLPLHHVANFCRQLYCVNAATVSAWLCVIVYITVSVMSLSTWPTEATFCTQPVMTLCTYIHAYTHTHTRLTALFPGPPRWANTRKVKPIWI